MARRNWWNATGSAWSHVRYRYDPGRRRRIKTVELIEEETPWTPSSAIDLVQIGDEETAEREKAREAGGRWNRDRKRWILSGEAVRRLGFQDRVVAWLEPGS